MPKKKTEYQRIFKNHIRIQGKYFKLLIQRNSISGPAFGIIVKKQVGKAVVRNKIKRLTRDFIRRTYNQIPADVNGIIIAKIKAGDCDWDKTVTDLTDSLKRANIILEQ